MMPGPGQLWSLVKTQACRDGTTDWEKRERPLRKLPGPGPEAQSRFLGQEDQKPQVPLSFTPAQRLAFSRLCEVARAGPEAPCHLVCHSQFPSRGSQQLPAAR